MNWLALPTSLWTADELVVVVNLCQWTGRRELVWPWTYANELIVVRPTSWTHADVVNWSCRWHEIASRDELVLMSLTSSSAACWCRRKWECELSTSNIPLFWQQQQQQPEYLQPTFMFHYPARPAKQNILWTIILVFVVRHDEHERVRSVSQVPDQQQKQKQQTIPHHRAIMRCAMMYLCDVFASYLLCDVFALNHQASSFSPFSLQNRNRQAGKPLASP